jgi:hypothetical protein
MASENVRMKSNEVSNSIPNPEDLHSFLHYFYFKDHKAATASYSLFRSQCLHGRTCRDPYQSLRERLDQGHEREDFPSGHPGRN